MSLNHLLPLSALHAAAPGVLDVVFRPDGDFKGAPPWAGPMTSLADTARHGWLVWRGALHVSVATADGHWSSTVEQWRERWALDLRIPTVAARLAGLCARALGCPASASWSIQQEIGGVFSLVGIAQRPRTSFDALIVMRWDRGRAMGYGSGGGAQHPSITTAATDGPAFLRDLVLALAPKIAALKS